MMTVIIKDDHPSEGRGASIITAARHHEPTSRREAQVVGMIPPPVFQGGTRRHRQRCRLTPVALEHEASIRVATGGFAFGEPKQVVG